MCCIVCFFSCRLHWAVLVLLDFVFFFFKQKTAYDMRISDWSSDVCSSDLQVCQMLFKDLERRINRHASDVYSTIDADGNMEVYHPSGTYLQIGRASCRERVVSTCRSRWSPYH